MNFKGVKISNSAKETEEIGKNFAKFLNPNFISPIVVSLEGELGGGKTTFVKGFAFALGIDEMVKSPTFVIMKKYQIKAESRKSKVKEVNKNLKFKNFYHFDCYRVHEAEDISELGWKEIIRNPENIIMAEWGDKIKKILPKNYIRIKFKFIDKNKRKIIVKT